MGIELSLIGTFGLTSAGQRISLPETAQRLVAFLALNTRPLSRAFVASSLWLDSAEERSCANLRSALWRLRRPGHSLVVTSGKQLQLAPEVCVDAHELASRARRLLDGVPEDSDVTLDEHLLSGELLPGWYDDWVLIERERLRQLRIHALEALADQLREAGRYGQAVEAGLAAVRAEPLRESAHRVLMRIYFDEGNEGEALRQHELYRRFLNAELGIEPSARMRELVSSLGRTPTLQSQ
jgi:DNA-binding SARP family transcriptional activator